MKNSILNTLVASAILGITSISYGSGPAIDPEKICNNERANQGVRYIKAVKAKKEAEKNGKDFDGEIPPKTMSSFEVFNAVISRSENLVVKFDCDTQQMVASLNTFSLTGDLSTDLGQVTLVQSNTFLSSKEVGKVAYSQFLKEAKVDGRLVDGKVPVIKVLVQMTNYPTAFEVLLEPAKDQIRLNIRPDRFGLMGVLIRPVQGGKAVFHNHTEFSFMNHGSVLIETNGLVTEFENHLIRQEPDLINLLQIPVTYVLSGLGAFTASDANP